MDNPQGLDEATRRGIDRLTAETQDGTRLSRCQLAQAWSVPSQEIEAAFENSDLIELWVDACPYIPSAVVSLGLERSAALNKALQAQAASSKLIFLHRWHGGLGGRTVVQALESGAPLSRIIELAVACGRC